MSRFVLSLVCVAPWLVGGAGEALAQRDCDRGCLRTLLDQYLEAVVAHDPSAAPLVVGFRQTENAVNVPPGGGVWRSVTALGEVQRRYLDPVTGQAAYYGTVEEGSETAVVTVRVRVENRELTEAEWYLARADDPGLRGPRQPGGPPANLHNPEYLADNPPPERVVRPSDRADRATLVRVVDSYFDAITSHDGSVALTHTGCGRVENGSPAPAGQFLPRIASANAPAGQPGASSNDCVSNLENFNLSMVVARRVPLVDEEAQVVLAYGVFIRRPGSATPRNAFSEWFVIDEARIRTVYTAMFYPPPELAIPNWPPYEGNWPLPAGIVPTPTTAAQATIATPSLLDRIQIEDLLVRYYYELSMGRAHEMSEYFTEDAMLDVDGTIASGRAEIEKLYGGGPARDADAPRPRNHMLLTNPVIEVQGDRAQAHVIWTGISNKGVGEPPALYEQGREDTELVKVDGKWLISKRYISSDSGTPDRFDRTFEQRDNPLEPL